MNELEPGEAIERELALIKVNAPADRRGELLALAEVFSVRRPLEDHVGDEHRWLLTGLATVFDQGG